MIKKNTVSQLNNLLRSVRKYKWLFVILIFASIGWYFSLPKQLFDEPLSCVVKDSNGNLLGAQIADDGQWRFPYEEALPESFKQSILLFEDEYFYTHPGFNPFSIGKAFMSNFISENRRGGSTLTQQVIRLARKNKKRTYLEKGIELVLATRLEARYSKEEILQLYVNYAPFGGNVVGLESASWRYFGVQPSELTWSQSASLAVLPNAPRLIYPGKNEAVLLQKRNALLKKLFHKQIIDRETYQLSLLEPLPGKPFPLPSHAFHWTQWVCKQVGKTTIQTSISGKLQQQANRLVKNHHRKLSQNNIYNLAVLIVENETQKVVAYVGNHQDRTKPFHYIDMVQAKRSTGSTLKPFLYAKALQNGIILPRSLMQDIPIGYNGYRPKNFNEQFYGIVPANEALSRSLNVPFVNLLYDYGVSAFYKDIGLLGISQVDLGPSHYGLSLILGGAEVSLWEMTQAYVNFTSVYTNYLENSAQYLQDEIRTLDILNQSNVSKKDFQLEPVSVRAASVYFSLKAMTQLNRPEEFEIERNLFQNQEIAWKTGTSFGFKDAWSIGTNKTYTIGVWAGNADTEGRPNLTGVKAAAPLMFELFKLLPNSSNWLIPPYDDLEEQSICKFSGNLASSQCDQTEIELIPIANNHKKVCTYCMLLDVDETASFQVNRNCYPEAQIMKKNYVKLSPVEAYFANLGSISLPPPNHIECSVENLDSPMEFIFPRKGERIFLPKSFDETRQEIVLKLAHKEADEEVFWYLDQNYILSTKGIHELILPLEKGNYTLFVVDSHGNTLEQNIQIVTKNNEL